MVVASEDLKGILFCSYFEFFIFHSSFIQCYPLGSSYLVGKVLSIGI